jgi:prevent-host-death family protein
MKTVSALDMRQRFGQLLDEAAAGERIIIERAGQPRAALVPLEDLQSRDPGERRARQEAALREIRRMARLRPAPGDLDAVATIHQMRDQRTHEILSVDSESRDKRS